MSPYQQTDSLQDVIRRYIADMQARGHPPKDILSQVLHLTLDVIFPSGPCSTSSSTVAAPQAPPPTAEEAKRLQVKRKEPRLLFILPFLLLRLISLLLGHSLPRLPPLLRLLHPPHLHLHLHLHPHLPRPRPHHLLPLPLLRRVLALALTPALATLLLILKSLLGL